MLKKLLIFFLFFLSLIVSSYSIDVSTCQVISTPGDYFLTTDLSSSATCIEIQTDNVSIDCQGHLIDGTDQASSYGIYIFGASDNYRNNINISNCEISDYNKGIYSSYANLSSFTNINTTSNY
nr:hypothetical protein [Candidatus Woesearchaeota archaeon]